MDSVSSGFQGECVIPILNKPRSEDFISRFRVPVAKVTSAPEIGMSFGSSTTPLRCVPPSHPARNPTAIAILMAGNTQCVKTEPKNNLLRICKEYKSDGDMLSKLS